MTRAVLEGVSFGLRDGLELMVEAGMPPARAQIRASGGGLASPLWRQILADILDAEIACPSTTEGAAYGAGVLAAVGAGWFASVDEAPAPLVSAQTGGRPPVQAAGGVRRLLPDIPELYPRLAPWFHRGKPQS